MPAAGQWGGLTWITVDIEVGRHACEALACSVVEGGPRLVRDRGGNLADEFHIPRVAHVDRLQEAGGRCLVDGRCEEDVATVEASEALLRHDVARQLEVIAVDVCAILDELCHQLRWREPRHQVVDARRCWEAGILLGLAPGGVWVAREVVRKQARAPGATAQLQAVPEAGSAETVTRRRRQAGAVA